MSRSIAYFLFDPLVIFLLSLTVGALLYAMRKYTFAKFVFSFSLLWLFIISVSPLPQWLIFKLEHRHKVLNVETLDSLQTVYIMILGSGHSYDSSLQWYNRLGDSGRARVAEALRIATHMPSSRLVCSGNSTSGRLPQAYTMAFAAIELGYKSRDTVLLVSPGTTNEEALAFSRRFGSRELILVTSAYHMPRAVAWFQRYGMNPTAAPTQHYMKVDSAGYPFDFFPSVKKIEMTKKVLHEYGGWIKFYLGASMSGPSAIDNT